MLPRKRAWSDVSNFQNMIDAAFLTFYDQSVSEVCLILIFLGLGEGMHSDSGSLGYQIISKSNP